MKTFVFTGLILASMVATGAEHSSQSTPALSQHFTHKQAVRMVDTACTPEEHRELAQYFRQEAQQKREKEQYYREVAATYRLHPPRVDAYRNASTAGLYAHLADEAWDEALADDRIAQLQDQFAEGLAKSTK